jgi:Uma2 family endonuclease
MLTDLAPRKLTYDDYLRLPDDGKRYELIDGELHVTPAPGTRHQSTVANVLRLLGSFIYKRRMGRLWTAPLDVLFGPTDVVQPDLVFVSTERKEIITDAAVRGAPDLVIEVLSPSTRRRDEGVKLRQYEREGVREYWLLDPATCTVKMFARREARLEPAAELSAAAGDVLASPLFPGLELDVAALFE